jgi:hypothetical protein
MSTAELKVRLFAVLENNANEYWKALKAYFQAKMTKWEFDCLIFSLLGSEHLPLHNAFIKSLIRNVSSSVQPSFPSRPDSLYKRAPDQTISPPAKRQRVKHEQPPMVAGPPPKSAIVRSSRMMGRRYAAAARTSSADYLRLSHEFGGSPTLIALHNRMYKTALEAGLSDVSTESVNLMMHALEHHLKDILANCRQGGVANQAHVITARDLLTSTQTCPFLLGEDLPVNQERVLLMQEDY